MNHRKVVIAGASGLVGSSLLQGLLDDASVAEVHALGRREPTVRHPKLAAHCVDFSALPALPAVDEVYLALGTTMKQAGSAEAFRAVDFDANLAVARAAMAAGARRIGLVSAMGANVRSAVFYNRVKGELEAALDALKPETCVVARPSLLVGDREALNQPSRGGEKWGIRIGRLLGSLAPLNYRPVEARRVAWALLSTVPVLRGKRVLTSGDIQQFTSRAGPANA
ncbi:MAG TPA: NAD(P)H-binding protein [Burkholderiaceae bacterium]|nr:NAD(P)H-binding protein [Burkholderiaceae bacterium]